MTETQSLQDKQAEAVQDKIRSTFEYYMEGFRYDISEQIAMALEKAKISKQELATKLGTTTSKVTRMLNGSDSYSLETLARVSTILRTELRLTIRPQGCEQKLEFAKIEKR